MVEHIITFHLNDLTCRKEPIEECVVKPLTDYASDALPTAQHIHHFEI